MSISNLFTRNNYLLVCENLTVKTADVNAVGTFVAYNKFNINTELTFNNLPTIIFPYETVLVYPFIFQIKYKESDLYIRYYGNVETEQSALGTIRVDVKFTNIRNNKIYYLRDSIGANIQNISIKDNKQVIISFTATLSNFQSFLQLEDNDEILIHLLLFNSTTGNLTVNSSLSPMLRCAQELKLNENRRTNPIVIPL
jgi:hypothetical protein